MKNQNAKPPRWATKFLEWYCKREVLEDLHGDLLEYFDRHVQRYGPQRARIMYVIDVFKFMRSYTVRKPNFLNTVIHWIMIQSYVKSSGRNILRHKLFSAINIIGLAISMSVGLLVIGMLTDLFSYDKFHEKHSRIYRVTSQYEYNGRKDHEAYATTSLKTVKAIKETFTGIEAVATLHRNFGGDFTIDQKVIPLSGFWADNGFFDVFSFSVIEGNVKNALHAPFSIVITQTAAKKAFGDATALGKSMTLDGRDYTVTGVLEDIPKTSHMQFEVLGSLGTRDILQPDHKDSWTSIWDTWVYVLLPKYDDPAAFNASLQRLAATENKNDKYTKVYLGVQPLDEIMTGDNLNNDIGTTAGRITIWIFSVLAIIVVLSACLNYTNLSIARALKRTKEVGIRKTIGASKDHVVFQFITESVIISLLALLFSFGLFLLIRSHFISVEPSFQKLLTLNVSPKLVAYFVGFAIIVGVAAGFFPALSFSGVSPVKVLKGFGAAPSMKGVNARKALIVFQFFLSIVGITVTVVSYKQYKHFLAFDLGFDTENILNIQLHHNKPELLRKEIAELPEVKDISQSTLITSVGDYWGTTAKNPNEPNDSSGVYYNIVDERYLPLHNHKLLIGQNFAGRNLDSTEFEVIVNESVVKRFNIAKGDPMKAVDETIVIDKGPHRIIGVIKDFSYSPANNDNAHEVVIRYSRTDANFLNVKILSSDWPATYAKLERIWKKLDPVHPFEARFYTDQIQQSFAGLQASIKVAAFLSFLVICIASIGLLGMVVFTTETRIKEVSIRKVLGSSNGNLMLLLGRSFLILVGTAGLIAIPSTYLFFEKVFLPTIANHAPVEVLELVVGFLVVTALSTIVIWTQTLKVIRKNPAEVLKME